MRQLKAFKYIGAADRYRSESDGANSIAKGLNGAFASCGYTNGNTDEMNGYQYSMCTNNDCGAVATFHLLKYSLLLMESCLPIGSVDEYSEDKWRSGETDCSFSDIWRESVIASCDPLSLMQTLIFLEYSIKSHWFAFSSGGGGSSGRSPHPSANGHLFSSRIYALRNASLPLIAMRMFALDRCIRYDKVAAPPTSGGASRSVKSKNGSRKR